MSRFNAVNLAALAPPPVVEPLDYEQILAGHLADFLARFPDYDVGALESDTAKKVLEVAAYRELLLRQRVNDAAKAVMLATAVGGDLEHLGALLGVERMVRPADPEAEPPVEELVEGDERYRERIQLSLEAHSTAGPYGAYVFYGLSASLEVKDVAVLGPESELVDPGEVGVWVLSTIGNGAASAELRAEVLAAYAPEDRRPLTDHVLVASAAVTNYTIELEIVVAGGLDAAVVEAEVAKRLDAWREARHRIGLAHRRHAIAGAATVPGVEDVILTLPAADLVPDPTAAAFCTAVDITVTVAP